MRVCVSVCVYTVTSTFTHSLAEQHTNQALELKNASENKGEGEDGRFAHGIECDVNHHEA